MTNSILQKRSLRLKKIKQDFLQKKSSLKKPKNQIQIFIEKMIFKIEQKNDRSLKTVAREEIQK